MTFRLWHNRKRAKGWPPRLVTIVGPFSDIRTRQEYVPSP